MITFLEFLEKNILLEKRDFSFDRWFLIESSGQETALIQKVESMSDSESLDKATSIMDLVRLKLFNFFPMWRPFYSAIAPLPKHGAGSRVSAKIGTMETNGVNIFYDPRFVVYTYEKGKSDFYKTEGDAGKSPFSIIQKGERFAGDYALFVIIHEIMHCSLKHHLRYPDWIKSEVLSEYELARLWNIAADYEINHLLLRDARKDLFEMFPGGVRADKLGGQFAAKTQEQEKFLSTSIAEVIFIKLVEELEEKIKKEQEKQEEQESQDEQDGQEGQEGQDEQENQEDQDGQDEQDGQEGQEGQDGQENQEGQDGQDGQGGQEDQTRPLQIGDIIFDRETGEYGEITQISGEEIDYNPISEEEAKNRLKK